MEEKVYRVIELFSGIGSQAEALKNIDIDFEILNTCEWNVHALSAYNIIHNCQCCNTKYDYTDYTKKELVKELLNLGISNDGKVAMTEKSLNAYSFEALTKIHEAIITTKNLVDISKVKGTDLPGKIDIMTYSFPCQDLSNVGAFHGYNKGIDRDANNRSGLLWEVERILIERKKEDYFMPKFLLMENVPALNSQRHKKNFNEWKEQLETLGYYNKEYVLNAKDFGLPQNRERLIMLSIHTYKDEDIKYELDRYFEENNLESAEYRKKLGIKEGELKQFLKTDYRKKLYKKEAIECQPNDTKSRKKIWDENLQITNKNGKIIAKNVATLTTKQDRHPNSGNLWVDFDNGKGNFRYLTPRECFLLMGFSEREFDKILESNFEIKKNNKMFTRDNMIKMAGNSIAVKVLEAVFKQIIEIDKKIFI